uniref:Secretory protein n=1 Tax=Chilobrachys guangxiensis TaxID=278060 RepID=B1P1J8_CHIGU|nr:secretory protein [Chilobrachys guangxiensis]
MLKSVFTFLVLTVILLQSFKLELFVHCTKCTSSKLVYPFCLLCFITLHPDDEYGPI